MLYRRLGKSGVQVSVLSLGSWVTFGQQIGDDVAEALMKKAYESGVNFFDNAEAYANGKSELVMGKILAKMKWPRDTWLVSSKVFWGGDKPNQSGLSRKHVIEGCHKALGRLQVDYLDLYFCHRPDPNTPIEETVFAMNDLIRQGKILYWGTSEWSAQELTEAWLVAKENHLVGPTMEQPQYNMFVRDRFEKEYAPLYQRFGLGTTIWSPLASGLLTGKYMDGAPKDARANVEGMGWLSDALTGERAKKRVPTLKALAEIAKELDLSMPRLAIAWCAKNPNVSTVILGASKVSQLEENLMAVDDLEKLTPEVMERIDGVLEG